MMDDLDKRRRKQLRRIAASFNDAVPTLDLMDRMNCIKSKADRERIKNTFQRESSVDANRELCSAFVGKTRWYDELMAALEELECENILKKMEADEYGSLRSSAPHVPSPARQPPSLGTVRAPPQPTVFLRDHHINKLPVGVKKAVCLLDQDRSRGWELLANRLGITWQESNELAMSESPSAALIAMWLQRDPQDATLGRLLDMLEQIERLDVVSEIKAVLGWEESTTFLQQHQTASHEPLSNDEYRRSIEKPHLYGNNLKENQRQEPLDLKDQREKNLQYTPLKRDSGREEVGDDLKKINKQPPEVVPDLSYQASNRLVNDRTINLSVTPKIQEDPREKSKELEDFPGGVQYGKHSPSGLLHKPGKGAQTSAGMELPRGDKENNLDAEDEAGDADVPVVKHDDTTHRIDTVDQNLQPRSAGIPAARPSSNSSDDISQGSPSNNEEEPTQTQIQRPAADCSPHKSDLDKRGEDSQGLERNLNQRDGKKDCIGGIKFKLDQSRVTTSDNESPVSSSTGISGNPATSLSSIIVPECKSEDIMVSSSSSIDSSCLESVKGKSNVWNQSKDKAVVKQTHPKVLEKRAPPEMAPAVQSTGMSKAEERREGPRSVDSGREVANTKISESQLGAGELGCGETSSNKGCRSSDNTAANSRGNEKLLEKQRLAKDSQSKVTNKLISDDFVSGDHESAAGFSTDGESSSSQQIQRGKLKMEEEEAAEPPPVKTSASYGDSAVSNKETETLTDHVDNYKIDGTNKEQIDDSQETLQVSSDGAMEIDEDAEDVTFSAENNESPTGMGVSPRMPSGDTSTLGPQSLRSEDIPAADRWFPLMSNITAGTLLSILNNSIGNNLTNEF